MALNQAKRSWSLANSGVALRVDEAESGGILVASLVDRRSGKEWLARPAPAYRIDLTMQGRRRLLLGDDPHASVDVDEHAAEDGATELVVTARRADLPVVIALTFRLYPDHALVRSWVEVRSEKGRAWVHQAEMLDLALDAGGLRLTGYCGLERYNRHPDWYNWREVPLGEGVVDEVTSGLLEEATWLCLADAAGGPGIWCAWEANVPCTARFGDLGADGGLGIALFLVPDVLVEPARPFRAPAAVVGLGSGTLDDLCYENHRFIRDVLARPVKDERFPWVMFNSWGYGPHIDAARMDDCLSLCAELGVEAFVVDFGWEDPDWNVRVDKFSGTLRPISEKTHEHGMLFGIHLSFGNLSGLSKALAQHPDWAVEPGQWAYRDEGPVYKLILAHPEARRWIVDRVVDLIESNGVDYFLTDHCLWGPARPGMHAANGNAAYASIAEGFDLAMEEIRRRCPDVIIEHCDDGGSLITHKMVQQHHTSIGADAPGPLPERIAKYRLSHVLPPQYLDAYARDADSGDVELDEYALRSYYLGGPLILMNRIQELAKIPEAWERLKSGLALYKKIRRQVLESKVLHLIPPRPMESLGYGWDGWDAIGTYHEATDRGILFVFRLGTERDEKTIPLHGLKPRTTYRVRLHDAGSSWTARGNELMQAGITIRAKRDVNQKAKGPARFSEIVFIEPV